MFFSHLKDIWLEICNRKSNQTKQSTDTTSSLSTGNWDFIQTSRKYAIIIAIYLTCSMHLIVFFCKHFVFHRLLIWLRDIYSPNLVNTLFFRIALNNFSVLFEKIKCDDKAVWESAARNFGHFFLSFKWIQWILARRSKSFITI